MDGGTMWDVNLDSAVNYCLDQGFTEEQVIVDMLICSYNTGINQTISGSAFHNFQDGRMLKQQYQNLNALQAESEAYPKIDIRYFFQEHNTGCNNPSELDFEPENTWCLQQAGRRDAQTMLGLGQTKIRSSLKEWLGSKQNQKAYPDFRQYINAKFNI